MLPREIDQTVAHGPTNTPRVDTPHDLSGRQFLLTDYANLLLSRAGSLQV